MQRLSPSEFAAKWANSSRPERAASQEHFTDICGMLGVQTPNEADPSGDWYAFEKGAAKSSGGDGYADVWKRGHFAWEYKGKRKDLDAAYQQLLQYREALESPPLLVVSDLDRFEIHTNFTGTAKQIHRFDLEQLARDPREPLRLLRAVFSEPETLRPSQSREEITEKVASEFASLARQLRDRGHSPLPVAHFLNKIVFCMFAEDSGLLPARLLKRLADGTRLDPLSFSTGLSDLFQRMMKGGSFGVDRIDWFNGGLFDGPEVLDLTTKEIDLVRRVSELDWSQVEPAVFGTLFERGLDPDKRSQLGAHYTDRSSILRLVEPVLMGPLRREFQEVQEKILLALPKRGGAARASKLLHDFLDRIESVVVLDPACGSGNFLYVALQSLKDFEKEVIVWGAKTIKTTRLFPKVGPHQLRGIEVNEYAAEIARVTIWIGEIQWMLANGFAYQRDPILRPLDAIECRDAILGYSPLGAASQPTWPNAEVIVGNPPFLGGKLLRAHLGDNYVDALFRVYKGRVPAEADLVTYWHEVARAMLEAGRVKRVGLLATQGIRGGANRKVLERVKSSGDIFLAWSDEPWILDGANVHVSFVGFDGGHEQERRLDGLVVKEIHSDLTTGADLNCARRLKENLGIAFMGDTKGGKFDITEAIARVMLEQSNPHGRSNRDVVRPWVNGKDVAQRSRGMWIIDFDADMTEEEAAMYAAPFEYVKAHVYPRRKANKREVYARRWWLHVETRSGMREALRAFQRFIVTPRVSKHRLFAWLDSGTLPDCQLIAFARDDDYTFGILHSRVHEIWARAHGTQVREVESGFRYTPTTTFETFPFPMASSDQTSAISQAARQLDEQRNAVLRPADGRRGTTLTALYNHRPTWLAQAHAALDATVLVSYGWSEDIKDEGILEGLLALNLERAPAQ